MRACSLFLLLAMVTLGCGGGDKHLPLSNPPEYDPKRVYTTPAVPSQPATLSVTSTELESLRSKLDSLEAAQKATGAGKKVPFDSNSLQPFKSITIPARSYRDSRLVWAARSSLLAGRVRR